jgi:hypothetical protein
MANRPAQAGAAGAGPDWELTGRSGQTAPPPVHHRKDDSRNDGKVSGGLAWLPYLIVLAGAALGLAIADSGARLAVRGTDVVGGALLLAAVARLLLPSRYAGPLSSRGKASDVTGFAVFGAAVLVVALMLS